MSDTSNQGLGVCLFLIGFTLLPVGFVAGGSALILSLLGAAVVGVSCVVLVKAKAASQGQ